MDEKYTSNLAEFIDKQIKKWSKDKKAILEDKLKRNFEAVTNADFRTRKWKKGEGEDWRSDTWIGFVRVKVWSFLSLMLDTVMKAGKIPFVLIPSQYDEQNMHPAMIEMMNKRIEKMTSKIEEQLTMRNADRQKIKEMLSGGYYGMAFSKFDIDDVQSVEYRAYLPGGIDINQALRLAPMEEIEKYIRFEVVNESKPVPGHKYVSVWNMVWDMDCDDFKSCDGYAEYEPSSPYDLRSLKGKPGYIDEAIERVIKTNKFNKDSGSTDQGESPGKEALSERSDTIKKYCFYLRAPMAYVEEFEQALRSNSLDIISLSPINDAENIEMSGDDIEIMGEIADTEIIRYVRNETGKRPHKMWVVEQNLDESTGTGIADNMASVQSSLVGMIRSFEDNKKLSANVTTAMKKRYFNDPNQTKEIKPGTQYDIADSCDDVRKAIMPIIFPDVGESLMSGIQLMMQLKDDVSMIPTIMQGFSLPKHQPDTAFEMQQLTINAGRYAGQAIRNMDEQLIEPEIQDLYEYNMLYDDDESIKVNAKVKANGFTSFQNKEIRGARMQQALAMFVSSEIMLPYVKLKPHFEIIYEAMDEDPAKFLKSDDEMEQDQQRQAEMAQQAQQQQIQAIMMQMGLEAKKDIAIKSVENRNELQQNAQEHQFDMESEVQQHEHRLIEKMAPVVANVHN